MRLRASVAALSFAQERLWLRHQLDTKGLAYNEVEAIDIVGPLSVPALERSVTEVVSRHEALRTVFAQDSGSVAQVVKPPQKVPLPVVDLSLLSDSEQEQACLRVLNGEACRTFDLRASPLLRSTLLWLGGERYVLVVAAHHIAFDLWSISVFLRELGAAYEAFSAGRRCDLPELPIQYSDYAAWEREWLTEEVIAREIEPLISRLSDLPRLHLPTDKPRAAMAGGRAAWQDLALPDDLCAQLRNLARSEGITLSAALLAAFFVLLHKYTGQNDLAVGAPVTNRIRPEFEELIGFFVNTVVLRRNLSANPPFRVLARDTFDQLLDSFSHQFIPFEKLVDRLRPDRRVDGGSLFQVVWAFQNTPKQIDGFANLKLEKRRERTNLTTLFDLECRVWEDSGKIHVRLVYNADLFHRETINRLLSGLQILLTSAAANPNLAISELPVMSEAERRQLLVEWNDTALAYPSATCLHELFEQQAERASDAVALVYEDRHLSYRELDYRSDRLASYLQGLGVGPEVRVAVCMERSLEMFLAVMGVLKTGGAYVPLDPSNPVERLAYMLEGSQAAVLLTHEQLLDRLPSTWAQTICVNEDWDFIDGYIEERSPAAVGSTNLAYIIYTSGSTGQPKGVAITHQSACNLAAAQILSFKIEAGTRVLQFASAGFDASVSEWTTALLSGGTLVLASRDELMPGDGLAVTLCRNGIEVVTLPPSVLAMMNEGELKQVKTLVVAGEECPGKLAAKWSSSKRMLNAYGPTEVTVCATISEPLKGEHTPPIGKPIANTQVYVVDERQQPVPVAVAGELLIGGAGLARGYLNRPDLTAERFIPDSLSGESGARVYRSGDKVRWLAEAELEYIGRLDEQVKIRGFRIEPAEIEAVLMQHASVSQCVVVMREDQAGDKRLVAYVVQTGEENASGAELRQYVSGKLPEYMLPSAYVMMESLPLTPNGKVDKRALPEPQVEQSEGKNRPKTEVEDVIAGIWQQVLKVTHVAVEDNFFELGGHSLLATQVLSRLRNVFQLDLPLRALFESPTVAKLARQVEEVRLTRQGLHAAPLVPRAAEGELPLSFAQQRLWFIDQLEPGSTAYNCAYAIRLTGDLNVRALEFSIGEIIRRHAVLRTTFPIINGAPVQAISPATPYKLPVVDLRALDHAIKQIEAHRLAVREAQRPFDLARGPLLRAQLFLLDEGDHLLLFTLHHILSDGWSNGLFANEAETLYRAYLDGLPSPLPELPVQYSDYAAWQKENLRGEALDLQAAYWKKQLGGKLAVMDLPYDRPRSELQAYAGATYAFALPLALSDDLRALGQQESVTSFMTLLAAFKVLLHRYTLQQEIIVGTPIAGRSLPQLESLIGFFANTLVLRTSLSGDPTFRELLSRMREVALEAYANQDLPFDKLVEILQPERDLSRTPLFHVMFGLQNASRTSFKLPGLTTSLTEVEGIAAKFDLSLDMWDEPDGFKGLFEYNRDLFDAATVAQMAIHYETLLESLTSNPDQSISAPLLLTAEQKRMMAALEEEAAFDFSFALQAG